LDLHSNRALLFPVPQAQPLRIFLQPDQILVVVLGDFYGFHRSDFVVRKYMKIKI
jgi:hypothetical protein